jgi:hypothetical protein
MKFYEHVDTVKAITWTHWTRHLEFVSRPLTPIVRFRRPKFFGKSGTPDFLKRVTECFKNLRCRPRWKYLPRGKILRQSETAKKPAIVRTWGMILTVCNKSGYFAHPFGSKFYEHVDTVKSITWSHWTRHLEFVSRPPTPIVRFRRPTFFGKSGTPNFERKVTERFKKFRERPSRRYIPWGIILRRYEKLQKKPAIFRRWCPILTVCHKSGYFAHLFGTKFYEHVDTVKDITWTHWTCHLEFVSQPPTPIVRFQRPTFFGKSGTPDFERKVTERFKNLRGRPRWQYLPWGKIVGWSETAKEPAIFRSWGPILTVYHKSGFFAHLFGRKFYEHVNTVKAITWTRGTARLEFVSRPLTPTVRFRRPTFFGK